MAVGARERGGIVGAIQIDLRRLHESWMALLFPRQRASDHTVLRKWTPNTSRGWIVYRLWSVVGIPIVALLYPLALFGFATRYYARRIDEAAAALGVLGVVVVAAIAWGGLSVVAHLRFTTSGFLAVLAAGVVGTIAAGLAVVFSRIGGRGTTVALAYPAGTTALFLPPVAAALFSPVLGDVVLDGSYTLAAWLLQNVLVVGGVNEFLHARFDLVGAAYLGMWFAIAVPVGWLLGITVALADLIRP